MPFGNTEDDLALSIDQKEQSFSFSCFYNENCYKARLVSRIKGSIYFSFTIEEMYKKE